MVVFLGAACVGGIALMSGHYVLAAINGILMIANFVLYQHNSAIVRQELDRNSSSVAP